LPRKQNANTVAESIQGRLNRSLPGWPPPRTILGAGLQPHTGPLQEAHTRLHGCALHGAGLLPSTLSHCPGQKGRPSTELALPALPREKRKHGCEVHEQRFNRSLPGWPAKKELLETGLQPHTGPLKNKKEGCTVVQCTERDPYRAFLATAQKQSKEKSSAAELHSN